MNSAESVDARVELHLGTRVRKRRRRQRGMARRWLLLLLLQVLLQLEHVAKADRETLENKGWRTGSAKTDEGTPADAVRNHHSGGRRAANSHAIDVGTVRRAAVHYVT